MSSHDIDTRIIARTAIFEALVARAERAHAARMDESAARAAMTAAAFAWRCPFGRLAEPRLERLLATIGSRTLGAPSRIHAAATNPRRILHVATRADGIGGHTRILSRWISTDLAREHVVVLTSQGDTPVPERLRQALSTGGQNELHSLRGSRLLDRARSTAAIAATCDRAVIHSAPSDVVPPLALAGPHRPVPTIVVDHADHVFWLGTFAADVVAHFRPFAQELAARHRGIACARSVVVPIPLDERTAAPPRAAARSRLGLRASDVLIITVASEYKFGDAHGPHFLDAVLPAIGADTATVVRAIGPRPIGPWAAAEKATQGRVRALGEQPEVADYYIAADIYLDSFPVPSFTSILEAALAGVPVITRSGLNSSDGLLELEELDGNDGFVRAGGPAEVTSAIRHWLADPEARISAGAALRERVRARHTGSEWLSSVELAYDRAIAVRGDAWAATDPLPSTSVAELAELHRRGGIDAAFLSAVWKETPGTPAARLRELVCSAWALRREPDLLGAWAARVGHRGRDHLRSSRPAH